MAEEGVQESIQESRQEQSNEAPNREAAASSDCIYQLKWIPWKNDFIPIITQNENGPCPLLALCNLLILSDTMHISPGQITITSMELINLLGSCLVHFKPKNLIESEVSNYEQNMQDAIVMFPRLLTGLDINVRFDSVSGFEFTQELAIFDLLNVQLYHGWLPDPSDISTHSLVSKLTYNQLVEQAINDASSEDCSKVNAALILQDFLESTATQLTYHGLCELSRVVREGEFCVFFRNNHFNTMLKRKDELLLLVTDYGFLNELGHVWQVLSDIDDSGDFLDANFKLSTNTTSVTKLTSTELTSSTVVIEAPRGEKPTQKNTNLDEEIAMSLMTGGSTSQIDIPGVGSGIRDPPETTKEQHLTDEEFALQLYSEEMNRLEQEQQQHIHQPHQQLPRVAPSQPNTREEYEQLALRDVRARRGSNKQCQLM